MVNSTLAVGTADILLLLTPELIKHNPMKMYREIEVQLHTHSKLWHQMGIRDQLHALAALPPVPTGEGARWAPNFSWTWW